MKRVPFRLIIIMILVGFLAPLGLLPLRTPVTFPVEARASKTPDQITLTFGEAPATSMTVQWRSTVDVTEGMLRYQKKSAVNASRTELAQSVQAETHLLTYPYLLGKVSEHKHVARLSDLEPATTYRYSIDGESGTSTGDSREFTTAPNDAEEFSFLYIGDIQKGFDALPLLFRRAEMIAPEAAFCISAGDMVDKAVSHPQWDQFYYYSGAVFSSMPLLPTIGNHELYRGSPEIYLKQFSLPRNGPDNLAHGQAYTVQYGQVFIISLDSNLPVESQSGWLEEELSASDAVWKFAVFHHPVYSSHPKRDNTSIRETWGGILEGQGVDLVFQGHDHAYLRTKPMKDGKILTEQEYGTIYLLSVAGTKYYKSHEPDNAAKLLSETATFQVIDIKTNPDRLQYNAYTADGTVVDTFTLSK